MMPPECVNDSWGPDVKPLSDHFRPDHIAAMPMLPDADQKILIIKKFHE
jgi:hypothetical protein